jgi:hypothetical protein
MGAPLPPDGHPPRACVARALNMARVLAHWATMFSRHTRFPMASAPARRGDRRDEADAKSDVTKQKDMSAFYRTLLTKNTAMGHGEDEDSTTKLPEGWSVATLGRASFLTRARRHRALTVPLVARGSPRAARRCSDAVRCVRGDVAMRG